MALFIKQDFSPAVLSKRWIAMKFRPNMLMYSRKNIIAILESGLLFREDSIEVEQETPIEEVSWLHAGGTRNGWLTTGEKGLALFVTASLVFIAPPKDLHRWTVVRLVSYMLVPPVVCAVHRSRCSGYIPMLLEMMRDYMTLARRSTACCREYAALHARLSSVASAIESTQNLLRRQQSELLILMCRATSALLGNMPWLQGDVICEWEDDNLMKIHHAFLVVQSTLLKYIALAHIPSSRTKVLYRNHNERIYWLHNTIITHLIHEFKENFDSLERMYRLLKSYGTKDGQSEKKTGLAISSAWLYSDVHTGVARSCLELKIALDKCNDLDAFLDSCALNKQQLDLANLEKDIDEIIENISKSLTTMQSSQIRLKKLQTKHVNDDERREIEKVVEPSYVKIEDKEPEIKDEVFYFIKTEDDVLPLPSGDSVTGPGKKEKEATKIVLKELQRKLVKREDMMRERERQALAKTMPELKNVPEFPRQIKCEEFIERKGYIHKLARNRKNVDKLRQKIRHRKKNNARYKLEICNYEENCKVNDAYEANMNLNIENKPLTFKKGQSHMLITQWRKCVKNHTLSNNTMRDSCDSDGQVAQVVGNNENEMKKYKFTKKDLDLSPSSDSDLSDRQELLNDVRRHRVVRKKRYPPKRLTIDKEDESLKPIEYSFGTGMAMASMLQINSKAKMPKMLQEEVFIGDGEVSNDSGNDEDT